MPIDVEKFMYVGGDKLVGIQNSSLSQQSVPWEFLRSGQIEFMSLTLEFDLCYHDKF